MNVYFDLNIFDRIEKKYNFPEQEKIIYSELESLIVEEQITVPYSNAHLNDLFRGYQKNPNFIEGHLKNIERLTKNLCICQYWNQKQAVWHFREIFEFFEEKKSDWEFEPETFEELFTQSGLPNLLLPYKFVKLDESWKQAYNYDPMFKLMFPKSKKENTVYAVMEDIYEFQKRLKSDYSLYKKFKSHLGKSINKLKNSREYLNSIKQNFNELPKHLDIFELSELHAPKNKYVKNEAYSKILDVFYKYDLKGYKTDANYNNMFDDSLHTFYAAHCDFFVTNDDRCKYKAEKTYERLKINTIVIKADEYMKMKNFKV